MKPGAMKPGNIKLGRNVPAGTFCKFAAMWVMFLRGARHDMSRMEEGFKCKTPNVKREMCSCRNTVQNLRFVRFISSGFFLIQPDQARKQLSSLITSMFPTLLLKLGILLFIRMLF